MASVKHSTPADATFSAAGTAAWDAEHDFTTTGLVDRPRTRIEERVAETHEIAQQIAKAFQEEFTEIPAEPPPIEAMTMAEIDAEIGVLLRKKLRDEEDEAAMMLIMLASDL